MRWVGDGRRLSTKCCGRWFSRCYTDAFHSHIPITLKKKIGFKYNEPSCRQQTEQYRVCAPYFFNMPTSEIHGIGLICGNIFCRVCAPVVPGQGALDKQPRMIIWYVFHGYSEEEDDAIQKNSQDCHVYRISMSHILVNRWSECPSICGLASSLQCQQSLGLSSPI